MTYFAPIGVIKDRIIKMYPNYLNGKLWLYHFFCFINYFLYDSANKDWFFENLIFELENHFYSGKTNNMSQEKWWCYRENLFFNLMVSSLYSFNPCISISENDRYLSRGNTEQYESEHP